MPEPERDHEYKFMYTMLGSFAESHDKASQLWPWCLACEFEAYKEPSSAALVSAITGKNQLVQYFPSLLSALFGRGKMREVFHTVAFGK